jgi:hypothetical protein
MTPAVARSMTTFFERRKGLVLTFLVLEVVDVACFATNWVSSTDNPATLKSTVEVAADGKVSTMRSDTKKNNVHFAVKSTSAEESIQRGSTSIMKNKHRQEEHHKHALQTDQRIVCQNEIAAGCHAIFAFAQVQGFATGSTPSPTPLPTASSGLAADATSVTREELKQFLVYRNLGQVHRPTDADMATLLGPDGLNISNADSDSISCQDLCLNVAQYIESNENMTIKSEGVFCSGCTNDTLSDCVNLTDKHMQDTASHSTLSGYDTETGAGDFIQVQVRVDRNAAGTNGVSVSVETRALRIAHAFTLFPSVPCISSLVQRADPVFGDNVDQSRRAELQDTWVETQAWLQVAANKMFDYPDYSTKWFGNSSNQSAQLNDVALTIYGAIDTLRNTRLKKGNVTHCQNGVLAYVITYVDANDNSFLGGEQDTEGKDVIHVCDQYYQQNLYTTDSWRYGAMVHESVHHQGPVDVNINALSGGTENRTSYGQENCLWLAQNHPAEAQNNADTYRWFVYDLVAHVRTGNKPTDSPESSDSFWDLVISYVKNAGQTASEIATGNGQRHTPAVTLLAVWGAAYQCCTLTQL